MRNFIHLVIITVVIVIQDSTLAEDPYACCSANSNDTGCCLCSSEYSNCSSVNSDFKTLINTDGVQCLIRTTTLSGVSTSTGTTTNTVTFEETTLTESSTSEAEEEQTFTICVLQCPLGFYEQDQNCQKCDDLCKNCTFEGGSVKCLECKYGMNSTEHCCPRGTRQKLAGNVTICEKESTPITQDDGDVIPIIVGCVVGGVAVVVVLVVVVCCCLRRKSEGHSQSNDQESGERTKRPISQLLHFKKKKKDPSEGQLPSIEELRGIDRHPRPYENTATIDHRRIAIGAQQEQDKKGRYIKDPTEKNKKTQKKIDHDEEPQEVYENQATINLQTQQSQFHKKKKGPFNKLSQKLKSKKGKDDTHNGKTELHAPVGAPTEEYEEVNPPASQSNMPTEAYEEVGSNQPDFPQEVYEGAAQSNFNEDLPQEEYTAMDPSTQQPTEEYLPMNIQSTKKSKPTKVRKAKTKEGANNPVFNTGETIYENIGGDEGHYQNFQTLPQDPNMPEEEYQNYQGPLSK
ncbi:uncharacterized protein LOC133178872 isoform X2 [Saccostrea echinata]|uniref:uncharacterized protein LOC133178872 isoform X2 n=1 Tax=Saccostrea echinata TaxID=191078 RepID=UPI002A7F847A|nr:uncharacterized protein LOC133178872 isoform X2 [Saccostrea echinata]